MMITSKSDNEDLEKYLKQYNNLAIRKSNQFHDRFIILDQKILYHFGALFKDFGEKCFAISKIESQDILIDLLDKIKNEVFNLH